ncbi:C-x8-C-x5-C-x3-H type zinc finger protein [Colletotrichum nymphaeae SA-01]|uniref:C-x8-C-x5-C-x3-H type zinc finger protein n=1 Tax=Colletotrichum nymphaeae SA-01 TaxID=1460502 RepID=A0A135S7S2_9PEZI|nr:C-x8-C-x5-C-x3-H type zinc finger protein [Colletotrichum nymphaeae SA-01]
MVRVGQCKYVFSDLCHDNGYLPVLEPYKLDDKKEDNAQPKYYLMNADGQRIDELLPKVDPAVEKGFNMRMVGLGKKFCNNYHLHGKCNYPGCNYIHGNKISASEMIPLKKKSRGIPCNAGSDCVDVNCIFGHHCRWLKACTYVYCHFGGSHDINPKPRTKCFEDGSTKIVDKL